MKKKQAVKSTIVIPPTRKNEPNTVTKPAKSKLTPISEAQASAPNASIGFHWTELDIPFECPSSDCTHAVPPDLSPSLTGLFRQWSKAIYEYDRTAPEVLKLETRICIELGLVRMLNRAYRFAKEQGYPDVDLLALPERILCRERDILLLVSDTHHRDSCYAWENLVDELKSAKSSLEALEKGKSIPSEVAEQVRPG
jgi:hypothetical protein